MGRAEHVASEGCARMPGLLMLMRRRGCQFITPLRVAGSWLNLCAGAIPLSPSWLRMNVARLNARPRPSSRKVVGPVRLARISRAQAELRCEATTEGASRPGNSIARELVTASA